MLPPMTPLSSHDQTDSMLFFEKEGEVSSAGRFIVAGHNKHCMPLPSLATPLSLSLVNGLPYVSSFH